MKPQHLFIIMLMLAVAGCSSIPQSGNSASSHSPANGIYYWKTIFDLNETERTFLKEHQVQRLYLRFFDVVPADKSLKNEFNFEAVPNATIAFRDSLPENIEVIPVVYITIDALRLMLGSDQDYVEVITDRILNMVDFHELGAIKEVQLDCDWTQQTQDGYFAFCQAMKDKLELYGIQLSCTIRLWQLSCACPPVDRGVLMLYNTSSVTNPDTQNSILDLDDVKAYLKDGSYPLPLDFAYPTYSWYVWFRDNSFMGLMHDISTDQLEAGDVVRYEHVSFEALHELDSLVRLKLPVDHASIILYHLDSANLSNYTTDEIRQIYSRD